MGCQWRVICAWVWIKHDCMKFKFELKGQFNIGHQWWGVVSRRTVWIIWGVQISEGQIIQAILDFCTVWDETQTNRLPRLPPASDHVNSPAGQSYVTRVPTQTGKPGKMEKLFPVREKSGNFVQTVQTGKVREIWTKYWKSQGNLENFYFLCYF